MIRPRFLSIAGRFFWEKNDFLGGGAILVLCLIFEPIKIDFSTRKAKQIYSKLNGGS